MKKFKILFYRPKFWDGRYVDGSIATWTRLWNLDAPKELLCSHEEIWLPDEGYCWTSTMGAMGGKRRFGSGVRKALDYGILKNTERWFYCEFEVSDFGYKEMLEMMQVELEANKGYDKLMILNFFLPLGMGEKDKWICSEFVNHHAKIALKYAPMTFYATILKDTMSPLRTAKTLWKAGINFYKMNGNLLLAGKEQK